MVPAYTLLSKDDKESRAKPELDTAVIRIPSYARGNRPYFGIFMSSHLNKS